MAHASVGRLVSRQLLNLVGGVAAFDSSAEAEPLGRLGQDHRRLIVAGDGLGIGGRDLDGVMPAATHHRELVVRDAADEGLQLRGPAEEVAADIGAVLRSEALQVTIDDAIEGIGEHAVAIGVEQRIPLAGPKHLHDVPPCTGEHALELAHDTAIPAHRTIEALEVAVHDPDEVAELLARGDGQRPERFGLVALPIPDEAPDLGVSVPVDPPVVQVAVEAGVVDRVEGPMPIDTVGYSQNSDMSRGCG